MAEDQALQVDILGVVEHVRMCNMQSKMVHP